MVTIITSGKSLKTSDNSISSGKIDNKGNSESNVTNDKTIKTQDNAETKPDIVNTYAIKNASFKDDEINWNDNLINEAYVFSGTKKNNIIIDPETGKRIFYDFRYNDDKWGKNNYLKIADQFNRVSLNICPVTYRGNNTFVPEYQFNNKRLPYILGDDDNGLLRRNLESTYGVIFPYTPTISMSYQAEYDSSTILHSNLSINMYKNTPPSFIDLTADFTADNEVNAEYMYAVMIFLKAMTKTDFGIKAKERDAAGMPPPILYLNGWGSTYNNIPVILKGFTVNYNKDQQYVYLKEYDVWLPTDISFHISLNIQPNLEKYKNQFDLNAYKNNTLDNEKNITLTTATKLVKGTQKGEVENVIYSTSKEELEEILSEETHWYNPLTWFKSVNEIEDGNGNTLYELNTGKQDVERDVFKLSSYKKKVQYSGHGWTW